MSGVKRYDRYDANAMYEAVDGGFVESSDFDALAHELSLSEAMVESLGESAVMVQPLRDDVADLRGQLAASEARCEWLAEMAANNERECTNQLIKINARDKQLAELKQAFSESQEEVVSRGKLLADAVGLLRKGKAHCQGFSELWEKEVDTFLTTIEQDKANG